MGEQKSFDFEVFRRQLTSLIVLQAVAVMLLGWMAWTNYHKPKELRYEKIGDGITGYRTFDPETGESQLRQH